MLGLDPLGRCGSQTSVPAGRSSGVRSRRLRVSSGSRGSLAVVKWPSFFHPSDPRPMIVAWRVWPLGSRSSTGSPLIGCISLGSSSTSRCRRTTGAICTPSPMTFARFRGNVSRNCVCWGRCSRGAGRLVRHLEERGVSRGLGRGLGRMLDPGGGLLEGGGAREACRDWRG